MWVQATLLGRQTLRAGCLLPQIPILGFQGAQEAGTGHLAPAECPQQRPATALPLPSGLGPLRLQGEFRRAQGASWGFRGPASEQQEVTHALAHTRPAASHPGLAVTAPTVGQQLDIHEEREGPRLAVVHLAPGGGVSVRSYPSAQRLVPPLPPCPLSLRPVCLRRGLGSLTWLCR